MKNLKFQIWLKLAEMPKVFIKKEFKAMSNRKSQIFSTRKCFILLQLILLLCVSGVVFAEDFRDAYPPYRVRDVPCYGPSEEMTKTDNYYIYIDRRMAEIFRDCIPGQPTLSGLTNNDIAKLVFSAFEQWNFHTRGPVFIFGGFYDHVDDDSNCLSDQNIKRPAVLIKASKNPSTPRVGAAASVGWYSYDQCGSQLKEMIVWGSRGPLSCEFDPIRPFFNATSTQNTLLHELGHVLGLLDIYLIDYEDYLGGGGLEGLGIDIPTSVMDSKPTTNFTDIDGNNGSRIGYGIIYQWDKACVMRQSNRPMKYRIASLTRANGLNGLININNTQTIKTITNRYPNTEPSRTVITSKGFVSNKFAVRYYDGGWGGVSMDMYHISDQNDTMTMNTIFPSEYHDQSFDQDPYNIDIQTPDPSIYWHFFETNHTPPVIGYSQANYNYGDARGTSIISLRENVPYVHQSRVVTSDVYDPPEVIIQKSANNFIRYDVNVNHLYQCHDEQCTESFPIRTYINPVSTHDYSSGKDIYVFMADKFQEGPPRPREFAMGNLHLASSPNIFKANQGHFNYLNKYHELKETNGFQLPVSPTETRLSPDDPTHRYGYSMSTKVLPGITCRNSNNTQAFNCALMWVDEGALSTDVLGIKFYYDGDNNRFVMDESTGIVLIKEDLTASGLSMTTIDDMFCLAFKSRTHVPEARYMCLSENLDSVRAAGSVRDPYMVGAPTWLTALDGDPKLVWTSLITDNGDKGIKILDEGCNFCHSNKQNLPALQSQTMINYGEFTYSDHSFYHNPWFLGQKR